MPLAAGTRLGPYEITAPLGTGGMGEVYRARDTKLNRNVAIKVLPELLAQDPGALARFEREAQAVAALSHPNILAIHDFGSDHGIAFAVTELLEGQTLRARLADGALPVRKATEIGTQIVRGIAAAHGQGIIHRDLKPENIFITKDGVVKILDFGLAKAVLVTAGRASDATVGAVETRIAADTTPGTVLGTVGYMSPEQVRGLPLDHRTDIFSFGTVLYEMLTGRRPFRGDSHVETMNAILKEDPPEFAEINPNLSGALERIVRRCLEKQPGDRFHSAHDLAISLEAISGASSHSGASWRAEAAAIPSPRRRLLPGIAAIAIVVVGAAAFFAGRKFPAGAPASRVDFQRLTYRRGPIWSAAIAPDGATVLYTATWEGSPRQVYSTRSDSPESMALQYVNADVTSISSKGEMAIVSNRVVIASYARPGTLARAPLSGGAPRDVLENVQDAAWLPDGSDLAVSHVVNGKYQLEFPIGKIVYETTGWISHLRVSPDGKRVAFLDQPIFGDDRGGAAIVDASGKRQSISAKCESTQGIAWTPSGREVWFTCAPNGLSRMLLAASLDGNVRPVLQVPGGVFLRDIAADGRVLLSYESKRGGIMALAPGDANERDLSWLDWSIPGVLAEDGRTLLIAEEGEGGGPGYGAFLRKTDGSPAVRLATGEPLALSTDGRWAIVQKLDPTPMQLMLVPTGAGQARVLTGDDIAHTDARFLADGKRFVFIGFKPGRPARVWVQPIEGGNPSAVTPEGVAGIAVTPDGGKLIARDDAGQSKLYLIDPQSGPAEPLRFLEPADGVIRFASDAHTVLVRRRTADGGAQVTRLDLINGVRTAVRTIPHLPGSTGVGTILMTADGTAYAYGYGVTQSDLFLVKGLK